MVRLDEQDRAEPTYATVHAASPEAQRALTQYFQELGRRFSGGFDAGEQGLDHAVRSFDPPAGLFVVARVGDDVAGCGALQWLDERTAEIKRMWVDPQRRGMGLGRGLLAHLEAAARRAGRSRIVLDTNEALSEAISMYRARGYVATDRYNENPYAHHWFEKLLTEGEAG